MLDDLNTRLLLGAKIDNAMVAMHAQAISAMVRVSNKLGTSRRAKDCTPTLAEIIEQDSHNDAVIAAD